MVEEAVMVMEVEEAVEGEVDAEEVVVGVAEEVAVEAVEGEDVVVEEEMVGVVDGEAPQVVGIIVSHQSKLILLKRV